MTFHSKTRTADELLWFKGTLVNIRLSANSGADRLNVIEHWAPHGESPPLHIHRNEDEVFHILEGTVLFRIYGTDIVAHAGQTVMAPKGVAHTFRVESPNGARFLTITTGGDFERMVREMSTPALSPDLPPAVQMTPEMVIEMTAACARNGIEIIGAPLS